MFAELPYPPMDYHICPCCGTEFGNDDAHFSHDQLREMWLAGGARWFFGRALEGWNPWLQLIEGGYLESLPKIEARIVSPTNINALATPPPVVLVGGPQVTVGIRN